ncbi:MAG: GNAT family N-acetyltransferase [Gorillibacterium sp.]|nr:GNAT family N-acetyltransferase [Gorillibacterium sp.]
MIRKRVPEDDREILKLVRKELLPFVHHTFPGVTTNLKELRTRLNRGTVYIVGMTNSVGKAKVGGFLATVKNDSAIWLDMLAVSKELQGKGWGSALMEKAEADARASGCSIANLFVDAVNPKARTFYAKRGYVPVRYVEEVGCFHLSKYLSKSGDRLLGQSYNPFQKSTII